jgi:ribosomal protein L20
MTDFYTLFQELEIFDMFEMREEYQTLRAQIEKLGKFEQRQRKFEKDRSRVCWLRRANETTITIEELDGTETIQNRLEYEIQAGRVKSTDPLLKYI